MSELTAPHRLTCADTVLTPSKHICTAISAATTTMLVAFLPLPWLLTCFTCCLSRSVLFSPPYRNPMCAPLVCLSPDICLLVVLLKLITLLLAAVPADG